MENVGVVCFGTEMIESALRRADMRCDELTRAAEEM
jgi:hypothetical protein